MPKGKAKGVGNLPKGNNYNQSNRINQNPQQNQNQHHENRYTDPNRFDPNHDSKPYYLHPFGVVVIAIASFAAGYKFNDWYAEQKKKNPNFSLFSASKPKIAASSQTDVATNPVVPTDNVAPEPTEEVIDDSRIQHIYNLYFTQPVIFEITATPQEKQYAGQNWYRDRQSLMGLRGII